ncbi:hypothetical protein [Agrobacterium sp. OT33]|uniref:hypothetical protein n=1 Tax=Agrobacterium sp. OT33 TaxID=2815338 RepID=UPI001A8CFDA8|nr:hypothetical protein [Agrobacterium sp. OT33]MBO0125230.1 hypothetical protein [Agrobacterium sp. OT33]
MKAPLKNYTLGALQITQSLRKVIFGQHTSGMHFSSDGIDCVALKEGALEMQKTKSIITRRGVAPSIHRWIYANGWHAAAAFGLVACIAFPFSPLPSACLFFLAVGLAALSVGVGFLEQLIAAIEEDSDRDERLAAYRVGDALEEDDESEDDLDQMLEKWNRDHMPIAENGMRDSDDLSGWH